MEGIEPNVRSRARTGRRGVIAPAIASPEAPRENASCFERPDESRGNFPRARVGKPRVGFLWKENCRQATARRVDRLGVEPRVLRVGLSRVGAREVAADGIEPSHVPE